MAIFQIREKQEGGALVFQYDAEEAQEFGAWSDPELFVNLIVPQGLHPEAVIPHHPEGGDWELVEDPAALLVWKQQQNLKEKNDYIVERSAQAELDIQALLAGMDETTHLMIAMSLMDAALNISGTETQEDIDSAKAALAQYRVLLGQVQTIRVQRDEDMEDFVPTYAVNPLYPPVIP